MTPIDTSPRAAERAFGHMPGLDGLRGLALLAVLAFHQGFTWISGGYLPLTSFFVLSGFLITALLLGERHGHGRVDLGAFWARRFRRLVPASLLALGLVAAITAHDGTALQRENLRGDALAAVANVANWRFVFADATYADAFSDPSPLQHYWSLAVEEQFYLLFPLILVAAIAVGKGRRHVLAGVLVAGIAASTIAMAAMHAPGDEPLRAYFGTDARAAEILLGCLLAVALMGRGRLRQPAGRGATLLDVAGLAALAATVATWFRVSEYDDQLYEGGLILIALLAAVVVAACTLPGGRTGALLGIWPLAALGRVSYGVYLFHWPLFLWLDAERVGFDGVPLFAVRFAATLVLAVASHRFVELPIRRGRALAGRGVGAVAWANAAVAAVAVIALAGAVPADLDDVVTFRTTGETPPPPPPPAPTKTTTSELAAPVTTSTSLPGGAAAVETAPTATSTPGAISPVTVPPAPSAPPPSAAPPPTAPPPPPPLRVMVVGDSVAHNLATGLLHHADRDGDLTVYDASRPGCPVLRGSEYHRPDGQVLVPAPHCSTWPQDLPGMTAQFQPDVVLVLTGINELSDQTFSGVDAPIGPGHRDFDARLLADYRLLVDAVGATGADVVWSTPICASGERYFGGLPTAEISRRVRHLREVVVPALAASRRIQVADLYGQLCPGDSVADTVAGVSGARPDGVHISDRASGALADRWLVPLLLATR